MSSAESRRSPILLALAGLLAGALFFTSLDRLWPLARTELVADEAHLERRARALLADRGFPVQHYAAAGMLVVHDAALDYVERTFGRPRTQQWIARGEPLFQHRVALKRPGDTTQYVVWLQGSGEILGWWRSVEEDATGPRLDLERARELAQEALVSGLSRRLEDYAEISASSTDQPGRRDHRFVYERVVSESPELRERARLAIAGDRVVEARRSLVVPGSARRAARGAEAPGRALESLGLLLLVAGVCVGFAVFLRGLRSGEVRLGRAAVWPAVVFGCLVATWALERAALFEAWEPLWPRWVSDLQFLTFRALEQSWLPLVLLAVTGAGDALDGQSRGGRGATLHLLGRGRVLSREVARASAAGFPIGLICGGVMAGAVVLLQVIGGAQVSIQPRGFFFYTLNTAAPAVTSLCFFFGVALAEELGYRYFMGGFLLQWTGRRWLAVLGPALVYGLTHTRLDFLPPAEPFWARPLVLTLVGGVWGWAFLRYGALTVVLSHFTADLFIFNWPRLASGRGEIVAVSVATVAVPLIPALLYALLRLTPLRRRRREERTSTGTR